MPIVIVSYSLCSILLEPPDYHNAKSTYGQISSSLA